MKIKIKIKMISNLAQAVIVAVVQLDPLHEAPPMLLYGF